MPIMEKESQEFIKPADEPEAKDKEFVSSEPQTPTFASAPPQNSKKVVRVKFPFDGTQYGEEYLTLCVNDMIEFVKEEESWAFGRVLQRAGTVLTLQTEGWFPPGYVEMRVCYII